MSYQNIKFAIENGIASLILARHDVRNANSDTTFVDEIVDALNRAQVSAETRVLVLSAEGSAFSAGGNVKHMRDKTGTFAGGPATVRRRYIEGIQRVPKALYALDIPSIAAVQGPAIGAGCDLALYCDIIIASTQERFGKTFINVGMQRAAELIFTGRIVDGAEAVGFLVHVKDCIENPERLLLES